MDLPKELEAIVLKVLEKAVADGKAAARVIIDKDYPPGSSRLVRSPLDGRRLATISRTWPDAELVVTDRAALESHLWEIPEFVEEIPRITDMEKAIEVLREHAPDLVEDVPTLDPAAIPETLKSSRVAGKALDPHGEPCPGIEWRWPDQVLRITPADGAQAAIRALVDAGVITWEGRPSAIPPSPKAE